MILIQITNLDLQNNIKMRRNKAVKYNVVFLCVVSACTFVLGITFNTGKDYFFMNSAAVVSFLALIGGPVGFVIIRVTPIVFFAGLTICYLLVWCAIAAKKNMSIMFIFLACMSWLSFGYMALLSIM